MAIRVGDGLGAHTGYDPGDDVLLRSYRPPAVASVQGLEEGESGVWDNPAVDRLNPFGPTAPEPWSPSFSREPSFNVTDSPPAMPIRQISTMTPANNEGPVPPAIQVYSQPQPSKGQMTTGMVLAIGAMIVGFVWLAGR